MHARGVSAARWVKSLVSAAAEIDREAVCMSDIPRLVSYPFMSGVAGSHVWTTAQSTQTKREPAAPVRSGDRTGNEDKRFESGIE